MLVHMKILEIILDIEPVYKIHNLLGITFGIRFCLTMILNRIMIN